MPSTPTRRAPQRAVLAFVLLLHVVGLAVLWRLAPWAERGRPAPPQAPLWLPLWAAPAAPAPRAPAAPAPRALPPVPRQAMPSTAAAPAIPTTAAQAPSPLADGPAQTTAITAPDTSPTAAPPSLNLALPRGASAPWRDRHPGRDDPRTNTPRATLESRIAAALGGVEGITEEQLEDGIMRFRRGTQCVLVHPNRAERLDPWNKSVSPKMRGVEKC